MSKEIKGKILFGIVLVISAVLLAPAAFAHSSADEDKAVKDNELEDEIHEDEVPDGSVLVIDITHKVVNDEDSGNVGYWALDNYNKHVQVWKLPDGRYYVEAKYEGKWQTFRSIEPGNRRGRIKRCFRHF